jgi:hypothetical protein
MSFMIRSISAILIIAMIVLFAGCSSQDSASLEQALSLYRQHKLNEALPLFEQAAAEDSTNAGTLAWLAETYRRLGEKDKANKTAARAIGLDSCNSFALTAMANTCLPLPWAERNDDDSAWIFINRALECDSTDGNVWINIWGEAIIREDFDLMRWSECKLIETGFLSKAILSYARWMMQALPENAILITNGDMDTYPSRGLQQREGYREDVLVIERGLLDLAPFLRFLNREYNLPIPYDISILDSITADGEAYQMTPTLSEQVFRHWVEQRRNGRLKRPLAIAITVQPEYYAVFEDDFQRCGPFKLWNPAEDKAPLDTVICRRSFFNLNPEDFSGQWVTDQDHSSVHHAFTHRLAENISETALFYCEELIGDSRYVDASEMLDWVEAFESSIVHETADKDKISRLRSAILRQ